MDALPVPDDLPPLVSLVAVPGAGILVRRGASDASQALIRCLSDVLRRLPTGARVTCLTPAQNHALIDWDAERHRLALNS